MRGARVSSVARFRRLKAVAVVLAVLLAVPGIEAVVKVVSASAARNARAIGIDSAYLVGDGDAFAALERIEGVADGHASVPDGFYEEIGLLPDARNVRANEEGSVVGYVVTDDAAGALVDLTDGMRTRGWTDVPLGEAGGATFVKSEGRYTWALITCTQVDESTSVVVRCMRR